MKTSSRWPKTSLAVLAGLTVAAAAPWSKAATAPGASAQTAPASATAQQTAPHRRAFAQVTLPKHTLYVGELVPITIQAYYAAGTGVTVTATPAANTPDFTLEVGDPNQGHSTTPSGTYTVATWTGRLSPAKPGRYRLQVEIPSDLQWRTMVRRAAPPAPDADDPFGDLGDPFGDLGDPFGDMRSLFGGGDPFATMHRHMQQMMNQALEDVYVGSVQNQSVVLQSSQVPLTVLPLPAEGRPPNFSGAVGHFDLESSVDLHRVRVGEPLELSLAVHGEGNFDRVSTRGLPDSDQFKTYSPSVKQQDDGKTFVQAVVPQKPGATEIPPVGLAFFDPDQGSYVTARSKPIPIEVRPGLAVATTSTGSAPEAASGPVLAPNTGSEGKPVPSLRPLYAQKGFWLAQLAPLGLLAAGAGFVVRRRRVAADPHHALRRGARRSLKQQREAMARAQSAGDASAFFAAARGALQQRLGAAWGMIPEAITLAEVERRVQGPQLDTLRGVFEADAARFGVGVQNQDLSHWNDAVRSVLAHPEVP